MDPMDPMCSGRAEHGHGEDDRGHPREAGPLRQQRRGAQRMLSVPMVNIGQWWSVVKGEGELIKVRLESTDDQIRVYIYTNTYT